MIFRHFSGIFRMEIWTLHPSIWWNPGKVGLWLAKKNPGKSCELRMIHFGWFSGVLFWYFVSMCGQMLQYAYITVQMRMSCQQVIDSRVALLVLISGNGLASGFYLTLKERNYLWLTFRGLIGRNVEDDGF